RCPCCCPRSAGVRRAAELLVRASFVQRAPVAGLTRSNKVVAAVGPAPRSAGKFLTVQELQRGYRLAAFDFLSEPPGSRGYTSRQSGCDAKNRRTAPSSRSFLQQTFHSVQQPLLFPMPRRGARSMRTPSARGVGQQQLNGEGDAGLPAFDRSVPWRD